MQTSIQKNVCHGGFKAQSNVYKDRKQNEGVKQDS